MASKRPRSDEYTRFLGDIKGRIREAQLRAAQSINEQLLGVYREIGKAIAERQDKAGWGDGVLEQLASDLKSEFPTVRGFSRPNLFRMRQWYLTYRGADSICLTAVRQIPWTHNVLILSRLTSPQERLWYAQETFRNGWSKRVLDHQIESRLYERQALVSKNHNFNQTLPPLQSDLADRILKDPYHLDFLSLGPQVRDTRKPIGVSAYRLTSALPAELRDSLPSVKDLEDRLRSIGGSKTS